MSRTCLQLFLLLGFLWRCCFHQEGKRSARVTRVGHARAFSGRRRSDTRARRRSRNTIVQYVLSWFSRPTARWLPYPCVVPVGCRSSSYCCFCCCCRCCWPYFLCYTYIGYGRERCYSIMFSSSCLAVYYVAEQILFVVFFCFFSLGFVFVSFRTSRRSPLYVHTRQHTHASTVCCCNIYSSGSTGPCSG